MASEKEICTLALRRLGQAVGVVGLNEDSAYASLASSSYPIVRDALLERHAWDFATVREPLALIAKSDRSWTFTYTYAAPNNFIRILTVMGRGPADYWGDAPWVIEMDGNDRVIRADIANAVVKYVRRETNAGRFSAGFTDALAWHLAASLAGPIIKSETGMNVSQKLLQTANYFERAAISADVNQRRQQFERPTPEWLDYIEVDCGGNVAHVYSSTEDPMQTIYFRR